MIVYAESSAVLAWLLGEPTELRVRNSLSSAERVVTSALTALECARGLNRARLAGRISEVEELAALQLLDSAESTWDVHAVSDRVVSRARALFPADPVRTLDALHLATALVLQEAVGGLTLLSFDERIRANAPGLGLAVVGE